MAGNVKGPSEERIQQGMGPGLTKNEVRVAAGRPYLIEYVDGKGQPTVDLVFSFGGRKVFLFPKDMAAHLRKNMQVASDRVIDAIQAIENPGAVDVQQTAGLTFEDASEGHTGMQAAAGAPKASPINVMAPKRVKAEEVTP